ncbi:MerR family transcriptional regulator [Methylobacterium sp. BTF04]|uniref:MerR family transcriptional regulator n=1 Tax=Methylobacterium sp. BTF04 TaxID=2708300 RepID=UPI0013D0DDBC|nr:MerR family transcriptional regulator [Methylobacterium sp. BTF04]NEU10923.1 MerR family transcriptional regulator [Methylobacterium sp. BTF04]
MSLAASADSRDMIEKSATAFRTIKEVADDLDVPQHVLRFWETRFTQIRPVKRAGGRRYYRPDDVDLIKGIQRLLHGQGYTIKGAQRVLREKGLRFVQRIGRGEAEIPAPSIQEVEGPDDVTSDVMDEAAGLPASALDALEAALIDLYACRSVLEGLRAPPETGDEF